MITCLASLASLPATAQPIATGSLPMGVSLIGAPGADESLLASLVLIAPPMPEATR
jgi:Asp-tRNA(Asn)/Glu-tRNA(Gln) amidotransferase A subunit family amidase